MYLHRKGGQALSPEPKVASFTTNLICGLCWGYIRVI